MHLSYSKGSQIVCNKFDKSILSEAYKQGLMATNTENYKKNTPCYTFLPFYMWSFPGARCTVRALVSLLSEKPVTDTPFPTSDTPPIPRA